MKRSNSLLDCHVSLLINSAFHTNVLRFILLNVIHVGNHCRNIKHGQHSPAKALTKRLVVALRDFASVCFCVSYNYDWLNVLGYRWPWASATRAWTCKLRTASGGCRRLMKARTMPSSWTPPTLSALLKFFSKRCRKRPQLGDFIANQTDLPAPYTSYLVCIWAIPNLLNQVHLYDIPGITP